MSMSIQGRYYCRPCSDEKVAAGKHMLVTLMTITEMIAHSEQVHGFQRGPEQDLFIYTSGFVFGTGPSGTRASQTVRSDSDNPDSSSDDEDTEGDGRGFTDFCVFMDDEYESNSEDEIEDEGSDEGSVSAPQAAALIKTAPPTAFLATPAFGMKSALPAVQAAASVARTVIPSKVTRSAPLFKTAPQKPSKTAPITDRQLSDFPNVVCDKCKQKDLECHWDMHGLACAECYFLGRPCKTNGVKPATLWKAYKEANPTINRTNYVAPTYKTLLPDRAARRKVAAGKKSHEEKNTLAKAKRDKKAAQAVVQS